MTLTDRVVLEVSAFNRTGVFAFRGDLEPTRELTHDYLVGGRGQVLSELYSQASDIDPTDILPDADTPRRAGYHVDAGAGVSSFTITATVGTGDGDLPWGDGSSDVGDANAYDAAGDVAPKTKRDILFRWLAEGRSDSGGQMQLHTGEWTDGSYSDQAGVYGEPVPVALLNVRAEKKPDDSSVVTYTLEFERTAKIPDVVDSFVDDSTTAAENAVDELGDTIPDW